LLQTFAPIIKKKIISDQIYHLTFKAKDLVKNAKPGQFINIRVTNGFYPYLRRPFSICEVNDGALSILFSVFGMGTKTLAEANVGDSFDIIGPLGNGFSTDEDFENAIIVAGGLGSAPFPFLTSILNPKIRIRSFVGARTKELVITYKMKNVSIATDDGSLGKKMNVVQLLRKEYLKSGFPEKTKIFGCGPTPMLKALSKFAIEIDLNCEVSTECAMACGFGICQGCPIESSNGEQFFLVCKDGPVFNVKNVKL
jgi:dihydroorotate dehydrogenase electron transfer subunit